MDTNCESKAKIDSLSNKKSDEAIIEKIAEVSKEDKLPEFEYSVPRNRFRHYQINYWYSRY